VKERQDVRLISLAVAPAIWLAHFSLVYLWASLSCGLSLRMAPESVNALGTFFLTAAAFGACVRGMLIHHASWRQARGRTRSEQRFFGGTNALLHALAMLGLLWVALPAFLLTPCKA